MKTTETADGREIAKMATRTEKVGNVEREDDNSIEEQHVKGEATH